MRVWGCRGVRFGVLQVWGCRCAEVWSYADVGV